MQDTFYCKAFEDILTSFGAFAIFPIFNNIVSRKRLEIEQNRPKVWTRAYLLSVYEVLWGLKISKSFLVNSVHFRISDLQHVQQPSIFKRLAIEQNGRRLELQG